MRRRIQRGLQGATRGFAMDEMDWLCRLWTNLGGGTYERNGRVIKLLDDRWFSEADADAIMEAHSFRLRYAEETFRGYRTHRGEPGPQVSVMRQPGKRLISLRSLCRSVTSYLD